MEDDADLLDLLTYALRREGYTVLTAMDGQQGLRRWEEDPPDIVVLDANLPKIDGYEVCRRIRHDGPTPIVMLTARDEEDDVLRGFRLGADDYITKPFSAKQLAARLKAVLRRSQADPYRQPVREVRVGDATLDLQSYTVTAGDRQIQLTPLEFRILYLLGVNEGRVIPYSRLVEYAWGYEGGDSSLLKTHICHIRQKLSLSAGRNGGIRAVAGVGYSLALAQ
ncbi:MAG: response regulator transcription factor [Candidatus Limnocylindria bacterium]